MVAYIVGFIFALVLAALVIIWIAYCMFVRERHKSERYQYNIADLKHRNTVLAEEIQEKKKEGDICVGAFILPSRRQQKDEAYDKRPDYPESTQPNLHLSTDQLIDMLSDSADAHYQDGIYEVDTKAPYSSDV